MSSTRAVLMLLMASLVGNVFLSIWLWNNRELPLPQLHYPHLDIARNYIAQKYFIVNFVPLRKQIEEYLSNYPDIRISFYFEYLHTGSFIWLNQSERISPASLAKLPVAMVMLKEIEQGKRNLSDSYTILEADKNSRWGTLYQVPEQTKKSWSELIEESLINSDNTAHAILYKTIDKQSAQQFGEAIGAEQLFDTDGNTSVREMARLFRSLYTASYLNRADSEWILQKLTQARYRNLLRYQSELPIASKFGITELAGVYNEVGIVYQPDTPFLFSILMQSKDQASSPLTEAIAQKIMVDLRDQISKYITDNVDHNAM